MRPHELEPLQPLPAVQALQFHFEELVFFSSIAALATNSAAVARSLALVETDEALKETLERLDSFEIIEPLLSCSSIWRFAKIVQFPILSMKSPIILCSWY